MTRIIEPTGNGLSVAIRTAGDAHELALEPNTNAMYVRIDRIVVREGWLFVRTGGPGQHVQDEIGGDITLGFVVVKSFSTLINYSDIYSGWDTDMAPVFSAAYRAPDTEPSLWQRVKRWWAEQGDW